MIHNIPQPDFEQFVADELAKDSNVEIRKGVSFVSGAQVRTFFCSHDNVMSLKRVQADSHEEQGRSFHQSGGTCDRKAICHPLETCRSL